MNRTERRAAIATERMVNKYSEDIHRAAGTLIALVRGLERKEGRRTDSSELSLEVELTGGGTETWTIVIERTASSH